MHYIWKSGLKLGGDYFWHVVKHGDHRTGQSLASGYADTPEQALRNARNFIRNNQNAVYA